MTQTRSEGGGDGKEDLVSPAGPVSLPIHPVPVLHTYGDPQPYLLAKSDDVPVRSTTSPGPSVDGPRDDDGHQDRKVAMTSKDLHSATGGEAGAATKVTCQAGAIDNDPPRGGRCRSAILEHDTRCGAPDR